MLTFALRVEVRPKKSVRFGFWAPAGDVPELQPYDYAKIPGKLLIINPHDMMIAEIITG